MPGVITTLQGLPRAWKWLSSSAAKVACIAPCVRLVGDNAGSWLTELRGAMEAVQRVRDEGPAPVR